MGSFQFITCSKLAHTPLSEMYLFVLVFEVRWN